MTDRLLLQKFVDERDQPAFTELVDRHGGMVMATARRLAGQDADDIAQAVFLLLSQKAKKLTGHVNLAGWLYQATCNCASNVRRDQRRREAKVQAVREAVMSNPATPSAENSAVHEQLDEGLSRLSETYKQVLLMRYMEDLSVEETALQLGLSTTAVMKRSTRGLQRLREFFQQQGVTTTAPGVANCLVTQAVKITHAQSTHLSSVTMTGASTHVLALAKATKLPVTIARSTIVAMVMIFVIIAAVALVKGMKPADKQPVNAPATAPVVAVDKPAAPATAAALPPLAPPVAGTPREAVDSFLKAVRAGDEEEVARYLPPGDDAKARALAATYVDTYSNDIYLQFPSRLTVQGDSTMQANDAAHTILFANYDTPSPIDALSSHLALTVTPIQGHFYVTQLSYGDSNAMFAAASQSDLTAKTDGEAFDYSKACEKWNAMNQSMMSMGDPYALKDSDMPRYLDLLEKSRILLKEIADALKGSRLELAGDDVKACDDEMIQMTKSVRQDGAQAIKKSQALMMLNPKLMAAMGRLSNVGNSLGTIVDAQRQGKDEANHTAPRPVSIEPDRTLTGMGDKITIPGPLKFPDWLRTSYAFKQWQIQHDVRTFTTKDNAGNIYVVNTMGGMKDAQGIDHELIPQIRMYRPDKTLAEETNSDPFGNLQSWKTLDKTGMRVVWQIDQHDRGGGHYSIYRIVRYLDDGTEHIYSIAPDGSIALESTADAIGGSQKTVTDRKGWPTKF